MALRSQPPPQQLQPLVFHFFSPSSPLPLMLLLLLLLLLPVGHAQRAAAPSPSRPGPSAPAFPTAPSSSPPAPPSSPDKAGGELPVSAYIYTAMEGIVVVCSVLRRQRDRNMAAPPVQTTTMRRRRRHRQPLVLSLLFLLALHHGNVASANQYKVGDLDAWGVPPPGMPQLYSAWSLSHHFKIGDSLLFLYPPSLDSVVQVTEVAFNTCRVGEPILKMGDGNSLFNITAPGEFYFTSGIPGRCQKHQRLHISVPSGNGTFFPPSAAGAPPGRFPPVPRLTPPSSARRAGVGVPVAAWWHADGRVGAARTGAPCLRSFFVDKDCVFVSVWCIINFC